MDCNFIVSLCFMIWYSLWCCSLVHYLVLGRIELTPNGLWWYFILFYKCVYFIQVRFLFLSNHCFIYIICVVWFRYTKIISWRFINVNILQFLKYCLQGVWIDPLLFPLYLFSFTIEFLWVEVNLIGGWMITLSFIQLCERCVPHIERNITSTLKLCIVTQWRSSPFLFSISSVWSRIYFYMLCFLL